MRQSHAEGRLRLWTLFVNGAVEAALVGFLDHGILHYFQKGFNPAYAKDDLGTVVLSLSIRACFDDPQIRAFDFMGGGSPYKVHWARNERVTVLHQVSRLNFRARCHGAVQWSGELAAVAYRSVMPKAVRDFRRDWLGRRRMGRSKRFIDTAIWMACTTASQSVTDLILSTALKLS